MIYITGDTHGTIEINKLDASSFPEGQTLNNHDYVIICGDFGLVFENSQKEREAREALSKMPWTTLFIDGNHENFTALNDYPVEVWNGGKVHKITPKIIHLMRGQVFEIDGHTFFTMGGATSTDKLFRTPQLTWWPEEKPNQDEYKEACENLLKVSHCVDYVITHTGPSCLIKDIGPQRVEELTDFFDELIEIVEYKDWYFGHFHDDIDFDNHIHMIYNRKIKIEE